MSLPILVDKSLIKSEDIVSRIRMRRVDVQLHVVLLNVMSLLGLEVSEPVRVHAIAVGVLILVLWTSHLNDIYVSAGCTAPSWLVIEVTIAIVSSLVDCLLFALFVAFCPPMVPVVRRVAIIRTVI